MDFKLSDSVTIGHNSENELIIRFSGLAEEDVEQLNERVMSLNKTEAGTHFSLSHYKPEPGGLFCTVAVVVGEGVSYDRFYLMDIIDLLNLAGLSESIKIHVDFRSDSTSTMSADLIRAYGE